MSDENQGASAAAFVRHQRGVMADIAGAEVGRPKTVAEVTPEWLTAVLRTSGVLGPEGVVA